MSSSEIKSVIVIGAGGNLGASVLKALLTESSFSVTVLSRESSNSTFPEGVKVIRANYDSPDALKSAFQGIDAVVSIVGSLAFAEQNKFIDAAIAAGVKRFIPSEFGSDTTNPRLNEIIPILGGKVGIVNYLKSKESEISWTSIITGVFFDWSFKGFVGFDYDTKTASFIDEGRSKFSASNLVQIGRAVVKVLERPEESKNQHVYVSSFTVSQKDVLDVIEKVTGEKWTVQNVGGQKLVDESNEKLAKGDFSGVLTLLQAINFGDFGVASYDSKSSNEKLGLTQDDLEESVKAALSGKLFGDK